jgi:hypothetical protein
VLTQEQLKICDELVELYKAQLRLVETGTPRNWSMADVEGYDRRARRIASLQREFVGSVTVEPLSLKTSHAVPSGSWGDR